MERYNRFVVRNLQHAGYWNKMMKAIGHTFLLPVQEAAPRRVAVEVERRRPRPLGAAVTPHPQNSCVVMRGRSKRPWAST